MRLAALAKRQALRDMLDFARAVCGRLKREMAEASDAAERESLSADLKMAKAEVAQLTRRIKEMERRISE